MLVASCLFRMTTRVGRTQLVTRELARSRLTRYGIKILVLTRFFHLEGDWPKMFITSRFIFAKYYRLRDKAYGWNGPTPPCCDNPHHLSANTTCFVPELSVPDFVYEPLDRFSGKQDSGGRENSGKGVRLTRSGTNLTRGSFPNCRSLDDFDLQLKPLRSVMGVNQLLATSVGQPQDRCRRTHN